MTILLMISARASLFMIFPDSTIPAGVACTIGVYSYRVLCLFEQRHT
ncbi:MAG: hypothetical protein H6791_02650 [Candidatus Nomurabacteria bacterium]|nr:MAG: hypothetical protein H6791_02650 [Candidatus Nomurabacteria bacterium]